MTRDYMSLFIFVKSSRDNIIDLIQHHSKEEINFEMFNDLYNNRDYMIGYPADEISQTVTTILDILLQNEDNFPKYYDFETEDGYSEYIQQKYNSLIYHMQSGYNMCQMIREKDLEITEYDLLTDNYLNDERKEQIDYYKIDLRDKEEMIGDDITVKIHSISSYQYTKDILNFIRDYCKKIQHLNALVNISLD